MPAKGCRNKYGERYNPLTKKLWERFKEATGIEIEYLVFRDIIWTYNEEVALGVTDEAGVEMPEGMGHMVVTKYKSKKTPVDWVNTVRLGKKIPLLNMHSFGYIFHIKWYKMGMRVANKFIYKFKPYRSLQRQVAANVKAGKKYHPWNDSDFWSTTKMERTLNKFFKKDN
jgi:hypothetical protein